MDWFGKMPTSRLFWGEMRGVNRMNSMRGFSSMPPDGIPLWLRPWVPSGQIHVIAVPHCSLTTREPNARPAKRRAILQSTGLTTAGSGSFRCEMARPVWGQSVSPITSRTERPRLKSFSQPPSNSLRASPTALRTLNASPRSRPLGTIPTPRQK